MTGILELRSTLSPHPGLRRIAHENHSSDGQKGWKKRERQRLACPRDRSSNTLLCVATRSTRNESQSVTTHHATRHKTRHRIDLRPLPRTLRALATIHSGLLHSRRLGYRHTFWLQPSSRFPHGCYSVFGTHSSHVISARRLPRSLAVGSSHRVMDFLSSAVSHEISRRQRCLRHAVGTQPRLHV